MILVVVRSEVSCGKDGEKQTDQWGADLKASGAPPS